MRSLARLELDSGGSILLEASDALEGADGPVKAGRSADRIRELHSTVQGTLAPVRELAAAVVQQLRQAGPDEVTIEFGVDLAAEAGAVIAKTETACHLKVIVAWSRAASAAGS
ncbi:hypothetical protein GCM10011578_066630 [Streptomyces fuscichromogenes]|uniref:Trypsin-co-occurring domain-containing protein n=2 Tax=Streptomyces fuscichromogenes TaxID=1324013 RepID=A0A917XIC7_9ACTN|nr:hypothetical protein GCM10011578_066630 [Streptomyces fuscichromogenes]